jgi:histidyl-tRNA synthetase
MLEVIGLEGEDNTARRLHVMRAIDKYERLGRQNVALLLGPGRKDESGDFTAGADLSPKQIDILLDYIEVQFDEASGDLESVFEDWARQASGSRLAEEGISELQEIAHLCRSAGYGNRRIDFDSSIVRGLEYYTGPVMEAELTFETTDENGHPVRFGSVGGGGRYDGLVERFRGQKVPATGFSIGVSRLYAALEHLGRHTSAKVAGPVVVLVMDQARRAEYQAMARELRAAGIRAEMYMGSSGMRAQMKYADKRGAPAVVIEGEDELARGEVTVKDLLLGAELSERIEDNREWREAQPAQTNVPRTGLVAEVRAVLARQGPGT